jgi:hypothetical protein
MRQEQFSCLVTCHVLRTFPLCVLIMLVRACIAHYALLNTVHTSIRISKGNWHDVTIPPHQLLSKVRKTQQYKLIRTLSNKGPQAPSYIGFCINCFGQISITVERFLPKLALLDAEKICTKQYTYIEYRFRRVPLWLFAQELLSRLMRVKVSDKMSLTKTHMATWTITFRWLIEKLLLAISGKRSVFAVILLRYIITMRWISLHDRSNKFTL